MIKKTLVFYFYIPEDYETNIAVKMHFECLKQYCHVFDKAIFCVSFNESEKHYLSDVKSKLFNLRDWEDIQIKVVENGPYRESLVYKTEIIDRLGFFKDEIVFFGHNKGVTNVNNFQDGIDTILKWIYCLYFYSFEYMEEVEASLTGQYHIFYGPLLMEDIYGERGYYGGTFYWVNPMFMQNYRDMYKKDLPVIANRFYAEEMPLYYPFEKGNGYMYSHCNRFLYNMDLYRTDYNGIVNFLGDPEKFFAQYNEIMKKILC